MNKLEHYIEMTTLISDEDYSEALEVIICQVLSQELFAASGTNWLRKVEKRVCVHACVHVLKHSFLT